MKSTTKLLLLSLLGLSGCGGSAHVTVYGHNGAQYTAPSLCAALVSCQKAGESDCRYDDTMIVDQSGAREQSTCMVVKK